ncbi:M15 family metallopeptidase [Nitrogeniibacter mangrovi]|uniref:M15 family metallopeptidase n=1 Tax=Nitrogeniibacter mangrovi TaxID=2016596 RepID=A0A6C1B526_9RHOO|nr:M15 family metallopeptidase [Nitrogeniibacter mangrovi]QID18109.1 M15 family metallopeptidase [Nitrogeniibacter mangrovi]
MWLARAAHQARVHRGRLLLIGAVLCTPSLAVLALHARPVFDFADSTMAPDRHITALLAGERLAAPPPLAPEIFTTREVELVRPATAWASRDWALLDDGFRQRLLTVFKLMRERYGYEMVLLEGYRSPERQAVLAALGPHVTRATPGMSYHQYGLAADSAFLRDGRLVISAQDPWTKRGYELYGALAATAGLTWGGQWRMRDLGHVELRRPGVLARTRADALADTD